MGKFIKLKRHGKARSYSKAPDRKVTTNVVYQGDNLEIMKELEPSKIQLIYIDPPFCAQSVFKSKAWGKKVVSFNDEWGGGVQSYIRWLVPRLRECHRLLSPTGVFCLHLDQRSGHYAKVELDKIFGYKNFLNQVIWDYSGNSTTSRFYPRKHDLILIYSKTGGHVFNTVYRPYSKATLKRYNHKDKNGRYKMSALRGGKPEKIYMKEGCPVQDVWSDCPIVRKKTERLSYPTQKPLSLLNRLIKTFTDKGDMVFDSFCGCGTTISSAQSLGRKWAGIDISKDAVSIIKKRMAREHGLNIKVIKAETISREGVYRLNPFDFERQMVKMIGGTWNLKQVADGGIDGRCHDHTPIQVKKSFNVGRPVIDSFYKHVKGGNGRGVIIARSFSKGAYEEVNKLYNKEGLLIDLVPSDDIIRDAA